MQIINDHNKDNEYVAIYYNSTQGFFTLFQLGKIVSFSSVAIILYVTHRFNILDLL